MNRIEILNLIDRALDKTLPADERIRAVNSICAIQHERVFRALVQIYLDPAETDEDLNLAVVEAIKWFVSHTRVIIDTRKQIWSKETDKKLNKPKRYEVIIKEVN